jgi:hypothetical protein
MKTKNMKTPHLEKKSIGGAPLRRGFLLKGLALALAWLALSPLARADCREGCDVFANTFLGEDALSNNTGFNNTAIGFEALGQNGTGDLNTAIGFAALGNNTTGDHNTASGNNALADNTTGSGNTAAGILALVGNQTGDDNTASGAFALQYNTTGSNNTATGYGALSGDELNFSTGINNTATGYQALGSYTNGSYNTVTGANALYGNTTGGFNTATGANALQSNTTGNYNTAIGYSALLNATGSNNIALGPFAGNDLTTGSNNIQIGNDGISDDSNTIRIGTQGTQARTFIAGISGRALRFGIPVFINGAGELGTVASSARFKDEIKPMDKASEVILALKPVSFRYKKELDPDGIPQFGLVAEDVEKVNPALVARDANGKPYTVRYEAVNAMLLNEFLKEHRKVQELESTVAKQEASATKHEAAIALQQKEIQALTASLKEQAAQIHKVSAQIEMSKFATERIRRGGPAPQVVINNP